MRKHWLRIKGSSRKIKQQWEQLAEYIEKYPESKITVYNSESSLTDKYFCLECSQDYNSLDLDVNSYSTPLQRLNRKPSNLDIIKINFRRLYEIYSK